MNPYERSPQNSTRYKNGFQQSPSSNKSILLKDSPSGSSLYNRTTTLPSLALQSGFNTTREKTNEYYPIANEHLTPRGVISNTTPMNRKPTYENGYQGLPFLTPFSPGREYKDPMGKSNIFTGSVGTLNTMSTPVNATPISMLKSLNMVNEEPSFEQFRKSRYQKQRKKSKSKTGVKGFLKKVLAKQLGEEGEEETDSDNSDKSEDETIMNSTSSPVKQVIRLTEPLPHMQYPGPMKQQFNPYGYQNQMMPPNQNFMQPRLQPVYPQIQPIPSPLASNGRKIIQVPVRQNHFGPNNMMPSYGQNLFSPYGPMRPGFGPGMPNGQNGYMFQQPNQMDPMMKARMEAEEKRKREQDEQDELERKKKQEILDKKKQAQAAAKLAQRKAIAKKRLKTYSWFMLYPILLKRSVKNVVLFAKKKTMVEVPKKLNSSFEFYKRYIVDWIGKDIKVLLEETAFSFIFVNTKLLVKKEGREGAEDIKKKLAKNENHSDKCCDYVVRTMKIILDKLITCTKKFPEGFFRMISEITENGGRLPDSYFSFFEISRMQFSHFGALKNIKDWHSKILIGGLVVIRMFLIGIFMQADVILGIRQNHIQERMLNLGSLIYHVIMDYLKGLAPITKSDVSVEETRVQPVLKLQTCLFERDLRYYNIIVGDEKAKMNEIIDGFYPREFFNFFLKERKKMADQLRSLISGWVDVVYEYSHNVYLKNNANKANSEDDNN